MKNFLLLIAVLLISNSGFSQESKYGVRAGYNISNLDFDVLPGIENKHRNGIAFGFFAEYELSEKVAIAPEVQFSSEGGKDRNLRIDYIQVPILFKFRLGEKFSVTAGPQAGIKVHEYEDGYKNFAFSGIGGLEYMISNEFFVDVRYSYGFANIFDDEVGLEAKNSNIQLGVGFKIF